MVAKLQKNNNLSIEGNLDSDKTLLFAHGFGTDPTAWSEVKKAFIDEYRLIRTPIAP